MTHEIDERIAESMVITTISRVWTSPGNTVYCARGALKAAIANAIQNAYQIGFLAGRQEQFRASCGTGPARPAWMDIRLDDYAALKALHLNVWPVMARSFSDAGYHTLGDLRWVPVEKLIQVFYVGRRTARQIRAVIESLERGGDSAPA